MTLWKSFVIFSLEPIWYHSATVCQETDVMGPKVTFIITVAHGGSPLQVWTFCTAEINVKCDFLKKKKQPEGQVSVKKKKHIGV